MDGVMAIMAERDSRVSTFIINTVPMPDALFLKLRLHSHRRKVYRRRTKADQSL